MTGWMHRVDSSMKYSAGIGLHEDSFRSMERGNLRCKFHHLHSGCTYEKAGESRWESTGMLGDRKGAVFAALMTEHPRSGGMTGGWMHWVDYLEN